MMRTLNTNEMTQQFDNLFMAPARAYMNLSIDYSEKADERSARR